MLSHMNKNQQQLTFGMGNTDAMMMDQSASNYMFNN